jgi:two-component system, cell cycle response regulator DivK
MAGETILIIDDNPSNLRLLEAVLVVRGYEVHCAENARQALSLVQTVHPRLVLTDIQLPGMDGLELTRLLKGDPATRDIVVIAVTAYAMSGDEDRAREAGCDGYITKPIDTRGLPVKVAEYLARPTGAQGK